MFKAKVNLNRNVNGKIEKIEREFTDQKEYENFLRENNLTPRAPNFTGFISPAYIPPLFGYVPAPATHYIDQGNCCGEESCCKTPELPVDLDFYENELANMEASKAMKQEQIAGLKGALNKLAEYKEKMKGSRDDLLPRIEQDIKKVKDELKKLES